VTQVRLAKADQLKAEAALLQAQASAESILANAQAALLQAQADLVKAQAKKVDAETEYQKVLNEIKAIDIQLKQIEVQSAEYDLLMKKAELEAMQAKLKVAIALANKELEKIARDLQAIRAGMEVDAVRQALALAQSEQALQEYLIEQKEEEVEAIMGIAYKYFDLQNQILEMSIAIFQNEIMISSLEAGIVDPAEALAKEIAKAERELARMEVIKELAESYLTYEEDDWKDAKAYYTGNLIIAQNELLEAKTAFQSFLNNDYQAAVQAVEDTYYYSYYDDDWYDWGTFAMFNQSLGAVEEHFWDEEGNAYWQWGYYDDNYEFVPFYTEQYSRYQFYYYYPNEETAKENEEKGIITHAYGDYMYKQVAGVTDVEVYNNFIDSKLAEAQEEAKEAKEEAAEIAKNVAEYTQYDLDYAKATVAKTKEYVEALKPKFDSADKAVDDALDALSVAATAYYDALDAVDIARINNSAFEAALTANMAAQQDKLEKEQVYNEKKEATVIAKNKLAAEENAFLTYYGGADKDEAEYKRDLAIAQAQNTVKVAKAAVTDAIVKAYDDAKAATATAKAALETAEADVKTKLAAMRAAEIALAADPDNPDLQLKFTNAQTAYNTAVTTRNNAQTTYVTKQGDEAVAKANYDAVNDVYVAAKNDLTNKQNKAKEFDTKLATAQKNVTDAEAAEKTAKDASEAAAKAAEAAKKALDDAEDALAADEKEALVEADKAYDDAWDEYYDAKAAVYELEDTYRHYRQDAASLDEETGWLVAYLAECEEANEALYADYDGDGDLEAYQDYIDGIDATLALIEEATSGAKAYVAKYENQYRAAYVEAIENFNAACDTYIELEFAVWAIEEDVEVFEYIVNMIGECTFADENGNIVSVEDYIANIELEEQDLIDSINEMAQEIVESNINKEIMIARLTNMNNHFEELIALYSAIAEKYGEILSNFMDEIAPND
jgi:hypothetical protein